MMEVDMDELARELRARLTRRAADSMMREDLEPETTFRTDHMGVGATKDEAIADWCSKQNPSEGSQP